MFLTIVLLFLAVSPVSAQDPLQVDAKHTKLEFENEQMRVLRFHLGPKEISPMHYHTARVFVFLTDAHTKVTVADGKAEQRSGKAGEVRYRSAEKHTVENLSDKDNESIIVELKQTPASVAVEDDVRGYEGPTVQEKEIKR
jgi:quercetin dioxygenase-like cupin family protein